MGRKGVPHINCRAEYELENMAVCWQYVFGKYRFTSAIGALIERAIFRAFSVIKMVKIAQEKLHLSVAEMMFDSSLETIQGIDKVGEL